MKTQSLQPTKFRRRFKVTLFGLAASLPIVAMSSTLVSAQAQTTTQPAMTHPTGTMTNSSMTNSSMTNSSMTPSTGTSSSMGATTHTANILSRYSGSNEPLLKVGSTGQPVRDIQTELKNLKLYTSSVDGDFGPMTRQAVMTFQHSHKLTADGIVGPRTWAAMIAA